MKKEVENYYNIGDTFCSIQGFWQITKINWGPSYDLKLINNDGVGKKQLYRCQVCNYSCPSCYEILKVGALENRSESYLDNAIEDRIFGQVDKESIVDEKGS